MHPRKDNVMVVLYNNKLLDTHLGFKLGRRNILGGVGHKSACV